MKHLIILTFVLQLSNVFSQNYLVKSDKSILEFSEITFTNDSVTFNLINDTQSYVQLPKKDVIGITSNKKILFSNKRGFNIIDYTRTQKKGFYVGFNAVFGYKDDNNNNYYENYNNYSETIKTDYDYKYGYFGQFELNANYFINNFFATRIGIGYNLTSYSSQYNVYSTYQSYNDEYNYYYSSEKKDFLYDIRSINYENYITIPVSVFLTPGNKFGMYAEAGFTGKIKVLSYSIDKKTYPNRSYEIEVTNTTNSNNLINVLINGTFGFQGTIKKKLIIFGGLNLMAQAIDTDIMAGLKIGAIYRIPYIKKQNTKN